MSCLFGGNSCTWVLILVIVFLLTQGCGCNDYENRGNGCGCNDYDSRNNGCGCGCGCN